MNKKWYKDKIRERLTLWESLLPNLDLYSPIKTQKKTIGRIRKLVTQPEAKWPNLEEIWTKIEPIPFKLMAKTHLEYKDTNPTHMDIGVYKGLMEDLCKWPKTMRDKYDELHPKLDKDSNPMLDYQQWWSARLKEKQTNKTYDGEPTTSDRVQAEMEPEKTLKRMYKKYEKEWNKKND